MRKAADGKTLADGNACIPDGKRTGSHLRSKGHEIDRRSMSDRLEADGATPHQAAKVGYKSFTCVVLKVQTFFLYKQLFILDRGLVQW